MSIEGRKNVRIHLNTIILYSARFVYRRRERDSLNALEAGRGILRPFVAYLNEMNAECGNLLTGNLRKIKFGMFSKLPVVNIPQRQNSAFPQINCDIYFMD